MALISWLEKKIVYHKDWPINKSQESKKIDGSFKPNQTQGYLIKKKHIKKEKNSRIGLKRITIIQKETFY